MDTCGKMAAPMKFTGFLSIFVIFIFFTGLLQKSEGAKSSAALGDKVKQLLEWNTRQAVIRLNGDKFRTFVRTSPRNYSTIVMFTALSPNRGCSICKEANSEFELVAKSWRYAPSYSNQLFFAMVDYDDGMDVFQSMHINQAPLFMHFPAKGKAKKADTMNLQRVGYSAEAIARWALERTDINVRVFRPPNYSGTLGIMLLVLMIGFLLYLKRSSLEFLANKNMWGVAAMVVVFTMISGQMWNHIRGAGFMHRNPQTGQVGYIHGSSQSQFIVETYIVILLYAAISVGFLLLVEAGRIKGDKKKVFALVGLGVVAFFFSLLLSIFRGKYQGYPYSFLL